MQFSITVTKYSDEEFAAALDDPEDLFNPPALEKFGTTANEALAALVKAFDADYAMEDE